MSIFTDGFGTIIAGLEGGGGSVVPPGGDLSGTYNGNVVCDGDVNVLGNLEIKGSLLVLGSIYNDGGWLVTVHGDMFVSDSIYFDKSDTSTPQSNFEVGGDLMFGYMEFRQCGGTSAALIVKGDLLGKNADLLGEGTTPGTPGRTIEVGGDFTVNNCDLYGANGNGTGAGGNGGQVSVEGSFTGTGSLYTYGGDATDFDAGNGGYIEVHGDMNFGYDSIYIYGGSATNGNAGNGGDISCDGNLIVNEVESYGGSCSSDSHLHRSGSGGYLEIDGDLTVNDFLSVNGGDRAGALTMGNSLSAPNAGYVDVQGNAVFNGDLSANGGDLFVSGFAPHPAGNGGSFYCQGSVSCTDDFRLYGGYVDVVGDAGSGGYVNIEGPVYIDDEFELNGGYSYGGNGGNGGSAYLYSDATIGYVNFEGGNVGGGSNSGNGGYGGSLYCYGKLNVDDNLYLRGGNCDSSNEVHHAGYGGYLECRGATFTYANVYLEGGNRSGTTTVASTGNPAAQGGSFYCYGDAVTEDIYLNGGNVFCDYPSSLGGNGGTLQVRGTFTANGNLEAKGGQGRGTDGGNGGNLTFFGCVKAPIIDLSGGQSNDSVIGADAAVNGPPGMIDLNGGCTVIQIIAQDGSGMGSSPSALSKIGLTGSCHLNSIAMTDRAGCWIYAPGPSPATLRLINMPLKKKLNDVSGTETGDISANLNDSIFYTGDLSVWYKVTGATV